MIQFYTTNGMSPSGKAVGSGPTIRGFESLHPSQDIITEVRALANERSYFLLYFSVAWVRILSGGQ